VINLENTPGFLRYGRTRTEQAAEQATKDGDPSNNGLHGALPPLVSCSGGGTLPPSHVLRVAGTIAKEWTGGPNGIVGFGDAAVDPEVYDRTEHGRVDRVADNAHQT
jgi:hypothetical protein